MSKAVGLIFPFLLSVPGLLAADLAPVEDLGLRVAPGFRVTLYADHDLANDIYAMTLDARGRVVVTGRGYIKTLHDTNNDGRADEATLFATTRTGGMGMAFDGNDLYFAGDGGLWRFRDQDGDGQADGPPEKLLSAATNEHGGHAVRKGPDGWWYFLGGNDSKFGPQHATLPYSPIRQVEGGALLRLTPDGEHSEILAHGFRNPYDFDFNAQGDIFTFDSDTERDFFLPWYSPTRVFHVAYGGHHGWRLPGWQRSWDRPEYYVDTVNVLAAMGRGSPTGVVNYRHTQFPEKYRDGLFLLDWTFGRIYFLRLRSDGGSYQAAAELFLEPIGTHGFAPTGVAVGRDGALFVSIGGRKTRGGVYKIEWANAKPRPWTAWTGRDRPRPDMKAVLNAPQPLEAWSRAEWIPAAQAIGEEGFVQALTHTRLSPAEQIRAIEILTELFHGVPAQAASHLLRGSPSPLVRARLAWALGRVPTEHFKQVLVYLAQDSHPLVRRAVLETMIEQSTAFDSAELITVLSRGMGSTDGRTRRAAARLASLLPLPVWDQLETRFKRTGTQGRLTFTLAEIWRNPLLETHHDSLDAAVALLENTRDPRLQLQAIRLIMLALGDWNLHQPSVEVYSAYELPPSASEAGEMTPRILEALHRNFPSEHPRLNVETARLLAMLQDPSPRSLAATASLLTGDSSPTDDFHYLTVMSRLTAPRPADYASGMAGVIIGLEEKLRGREQRIKQNWSARLAEVVAALAARDPGLAPALLDHPQFPTPGHLALVPALGPEYRERAAHLYWTVVQEDSDYVWSPALIQLFSALPLEELRSKLNEQWANFALREEILLLLAREPQNIDREKFLAGLESHRTPVVDASIRALNKLPPAMQPDALAPVFRALDRLLTAPKQARPRAGLVTLINRQASQDFVIQEGDTDLPSLRKAYQPVFDWFAKRHPAQASRLHGTEEDPARWTALLRSVDWAEGNPFKGEAIFQARACHSCHSGPNPLGPDLRGAAQRFSLEDLFAAILYPNRNISPAYQTTTVETDDGETHTGLLVFESADGVILQTDALTTVRLADSNIVHRRSGNASLMPGGLLEGLSREELADLYSYLQSLDRRESASAGF